MKLLYESRQILWPIIRMGISLHRLVDRGRCGSLSLHHNFLAIRTRNHEIWTPRVVSIIVLLNIFQDWGLWGLHDYLCGPHDHLWCYLWLLLFWRRLLLLMKARNIHRRLRFSHGTVIISPELLNHLLSPSRFLNLRIVLMVKVRHCFT